MRARKLRVVNRERDALNIFNFKRVFRLAISSLSRAEVSSFRGAQVLEIL